MTALFLLIMLSTGLLAEEAPATTATPVASYEVVVLRDGRVLIGTTQGDPPTTVAARGIHRCPSTTWFPGEITLTIPQDGLVSREPYTGEYGEVPAAAAPNPDRPKAAPRGPQKPEGPKVAQGPPPSPPPGQQGLPPGYQRPGRADT